MDRREFMKSMGVLLSSLGVFGFSPDEPDGGKVEKLPFPLEDSPIEDLLRQTNEPPFDGGYFIASYFSW